MLADGLRQIPGVELEGTVVETNIVRFRTPGKMASSIAAVLREQGVLLLATGTESFRAVTHLMVSAADIEAARQPIGEVLMSGSPARR